MHPFAFPDNRSAVEPRTGDRITAGDRIVYRVADIERRGIADEFLHDGDAFVTWDDGTFGTVKWHYLYPERNLPDLG